MGLGIWCRSGNYHARADFSLNSQGVRPAISGSDSQNIWLSVKQLTVSRPGIFQIKGLQVSSHITSHRGRIETGVIALPAELPELISQ